jgi:hypothetical protein
MLGGDLYRNGLLDVFDRVKKTFPEWESKIEVFLNC